MNKLYIFNCLPEGKQHEVAQLVSDYTNGKLGEKPQMLPIEPAMVWQKHLGVVALHEEAFSGFIGATTPEKHNGNTMPEVGSLWVPAEHRQKGIAHKLIQVVTKLLNQQGHTPYAFCNSLSQAIFEQSDYAEVETGEVPACALSACTACPMKPSNGGCCDNILLFKGGK